MKTNIAIKYGLIAGVGVVAYYLLFYYTNVRLFFNPVVAWGSLVIYLAAMAKACLDDRNSSPDGYPFLLGLRMAFATFAVTSAVYYLFNYLLYNVLDPDLVEVQKEILFEQIANMAKRFEMSDMKDSIKDFKEQDFSVTIANSFLGWGWSLIGGFLLSLGVAAVMRR